MESTAITPRDSFDPWLDPSTTIGLTAPTHSSPSSRDFFLAVRPSFAILNDKKCKAIDPEESKLALLFAAWPGKFRLSG